MSGIETADGRLDEARLESALLDLEAGTIDPPERDALMELVARSPAAQRAYLDHFEMTAMLGAEAETEAESGRLPMIPDVGQAARLFRRSLLAAAALLTLGALVAALVHVARPQVPELALAAVADTRWSAQGEFRDADGNRAAVREGATVRVESGTIQLRLESGATMIMQGPSEVCFEKLSQPVVRSGWLWIDSGKGGETFDVRTPDLRIRNLGTRFGIRVPGDGPAEVHLIEGRLEVSRERRSGPPLELVADGQARTIPLPGEPLLLPLARDPFPGIAELLVAPAHFPTTVLGQNPTGYWRLDDARDGRLANELPDGSTGRVRSASSLPQAGPGPGDGFGGFPDDHGAIGFADLPTVAPLSLGTAPLHEGVLFEETFDGSGSLDGRSPAVRHADQKWVASTHFKGDGTIAPGQGSATLAFEPVNGVAYTLEATLRDVTTPEGDRNWVALGFASGQSPHAGPDVRFVSGYVEGRAWMTFRGSGSKDANTALLSGTSDPEFWSGWTGGVGGDIDLRIVLDTTGGPGTWTATWFARRPGERDYLKVRDTCRLPNESIQSAGIAATGDRTHGKISRLALRAERPNAGRPGIETADGPARITRARGAVSCWLRRTPGIQRTELLWSAGEGPTDAAIHAKIEADGRIGFFMENGRYDVLLTSEETITDGRWHHLVASWSPYTVDLYLDGRPVAGQRDLRGLQRIPLPELRVGSGPPGTDAAPFQGSIDEVAVWDRMLTPIEVEQQYQSALGK